MNKLSLELYTPEVMKKLATNLACTLVAIVYKDNTPEFKDRMKPEMYKLVYPGLDVNISYSTDESETIDIILENTMEQTLHELQGIKNTVFNAKTVSEIGIYNAMATAYVDYFLAESARQEQIAEDNEWVFDADNIQPDGSYESARPALPSISKAQWFESSIFDYPLSFTVPKQ